MGWLRSGQAAAIQSRLTRENTGPCRVLTALCGSSSHQPVCCLLLRSPRRPRPPLSRGAHRVTVLHLLERVDLPELLIQLATLAISETVDDLKCQATLRTRIFMHHLDSETQPPVVQRCRAYSRSQQVEWVEVWVVGDS
ncbi:uncharacterized protein LOC143766852 [Ranitomeya variabilis]|uniref:uncharacterized protein LOC143766852 n=1 Tax=Ranitomeya variabilis TaxID=490064 RepID=UPI004055C4DE